MIIKEYQCVKSSGELHQEREIECTDWETYINEYIFYSNSNSNINRTFSKKAWIKMITTSNYHIYAEYITPLSNDIICHHSKILKY
jgi:hypothetical protein